MHTNSKFNHLFLATLALILSAGIVRADDEYKIKLHRPDKVGDETTSTISAKIERSVEANGNVEKLKFSAEARGTTKVLAISEKTSEATKIRFEVEKMTRDGDELYPAGTVIIVEKTGAHATFSIDGEHPDSDHAEVLDALLDVENPDKDMTDDDMQGTDKPQKVGDTWGFNSAKIAKDLADNELPIDADDLKGESKLVEVKQVNGQDAEVITTTVKADNFKKDMPDGRSISDGSLSSQIKVVLPVDPAGQPISVEATMKLTMTITQPNQGSAVIKMKYSRKEDVDAKK